MIDEHDLERGRLERLRAAIDAAGCDAGLFYDPTNIRYATGTSNMQVYSLHNPCRYVFVPVEGDVVLFEFKGCEHLSADHLGVDQVRPSISWYDFIAGNRAAEFAALWAKEIASLLGPDALDLAVDRLDPLGAEALARHNIRVRDGQHPANQARLIKTETELEAVRRAVDACDLAIDEMRRKAEPGMTENELWSHLHQANIKLGGEWIETRLLTAGQRTNPWYQECSNNMIHDGDLVAFDTDLIGVGGYSVDVSRTWHIGDTAPTSNQKRLHDAASEQLAHNLDLLKPGASFAEISQQAHIPAKEIHSITNAAVAHGIGLCNEYPLILNRDHFDDAGYDGEVREGMVLCVEALAAPPGGIEAVKLEEQVIVTATGVETLSKQPLTLG